MPFLSSVDNLLQNAYIIFHKGVDNFEIEHKHAKRYAATSSEHVNR